MSKDCVAGYARLLPTLRTTKDATSFDRSMNNPPRTKVGVLYHFGRMVDKMIASDTARLPTIMRSNTQQIACIGLASPGKTRPNPGLLDRNGIAPVVSAIFVP